MKTYVKKGESRVRLARRRAAFHVWVETIGTSKPLNIAEHKKLYLPVTGGQYLMIRRKCPDQTGHNDFEVRESRSLGLSVLISGSESICLQVCSATHTYVH